MFALRGLLFITCRMKYQHVRPPGTYFCSTYIELVQFPLSRDYFYYTCNVYQHFLSSGEIWQPCGQPASRWSWGIRKLSGNYPETLLERLLRILKYQHFYFPKVTFTTRVLKYQHLHLPGTSFFTTHVNI